MEYFFALAPEPTSYILAFRISKITNKEIIISHGLSESSSLILCLTTSGAEEGGSERRAIHPPFSSNSRNSGKMKFLCFALFVLVALVRANQQEMHEMSQGEWEEMHGGGHWHGDVWHDHDEDHDPSEHDHPSGHDHSEHDHAILFKEHHHDDHSHDGHSYDHNDGHSHNGHSHDGHFHEDHIHKEHKDHNHGHDHGNSRVNGETISKIAQFIPADKQLASFLASHVSTFLPLLIAAKVPVGGKKVQEFGLLDKLVAFAAGTLLGDVVLHLIPHAREAAGAGHSHSHKEHSHSLWDMRVEFAILAGIVSFFSLQQYLTAIVGEHHHDHSHDDHSHDNHSHDGHSHDSHIHDHKDDHTHDHGNDHARSEKMVEPTKSFKEVAKNNSLPLVNLLPAYMQTPHILLHIMSLSSHIFLDAFAISIAFLSGGVEGGIATGVGIMIHMFPHFLGDLAVLCSGGLSQDEAVSVLSVGSGIGAFVGWLAAGSVVRLGEGLGEFDGLIQAFAGGGLLYVVFGSVLSQLTDPHHAPSTDGKSTVAKLVSASGQVASLVGGIAFMAWVALNE